MHDVDCRSCGNRLSNTFVNLGASPLANSYIASDRTLAAESFFSLHVLVCEICHLVQIPKVEEPEQIFSDEYAYFSSYSESVLAHSRAYVAQMMDRFRLGPEHRVVEIASNDGYLLRYFQDRNVPVLGVEPCRNVAGQAIAAGVPTRVRFFGLDCARDMVTESLQADLLIGNNVLAHVPDLNDFVAGLKCLLREDGVITLEFPHLLPQIENTYYDTIYHEHFSYFSLLSVQNVLDRHGLRVFDVEEIAPQGGSLRIFATHEASRNHPTRPSVGALRARELTSGLGQLERYQAFGDQVYRAKASLLRFLMDARDAGKSVVGYGAPAKGNTLLNYCGVKTDLLAYTVDVSPHKQGRLLPGSRIPIHAPEKILETRPDYVLVLPWNIKEEIMEKMDAIGDWGGHFVLPLPEVQVLPARDRAGLTMSVA